MYSNRIQALRQRNPCLSDLYNYLQPPGPARDHSRIVCLDIFEQHRHATRRDIAVNDLTSELQIKIEPDRKGRILLIEDVSRQTVEELGSKFNIDPWFFASYIHQSWRKTSTQSPATCSLPSRNRKQDFLPLQYHRTVVLEQNDTRLRSFARHCNHQRKVVILPVMEGKQIGLIQHCSSVMLVNPPGEEWTAIVLVDPPISNNYVPRSRHETLPSNLKSTLFLGGCEDFSEIPTAQANTQTPPDIANRGMLDEFVHYWMHQAPPMFSASTPTLQALSYYPLKIVAAEWVNYIFVLGMSLREFELSTSLSSDLIAELEKLNTNLRILQEWRRRILSTQEKMRRTVCFVENHRDSQKPSEDWDALGEDYEFIHTEVSEHGERLEAMVPLVTSTAALIESQRSLIETANVTRLTILALIFVPLSFASSLFSMAEEFAPGKPQFWVYFATAIPLAVVVGLFAVVVGLFAKKPREATKRFQARFQGARIFNFA